MKKIIVLCTVLLLCLVVFAEEPDFRNVSWGMSREQILANEHITPMLQNEETIMYETSLNGLKCFLGYSFIDNKLYSGTYGLLEKYTDYNKHIYNYYSLKSLLEKKYGKSEGIDKQFTNDAARDMDPGLAVGMGYLSYSSQWKTDRTKISLKLFGNEFNFWLCILYESKEYAPLAEQANEEKTMDSL